MKHEPRTMRGVLAGTEISGGSKPGRLGHHAPLASRPRAARVAGAVGLGPTIDAGRETALGALAESLDQLLGNVNIRRALAGDAHTKPAVLEFIARDADDEVRIALLRNPSTPPATLFALARDARLAPALAANPAAAPVLLAALARHWDAGVRRRLALNPRRPRCTLPPPDAKPAPRSRRRTPRTR